MSADSRTTVLTPIVAGKLSSLIRLLASDRAGEVSAAVAAINRVLRANGLDIHVLAERVENANGKISEADMQRLFNAGFAAGKAVAAAEDHNNDGFRNLDGSTTWERMAAHCRQHSSRLRAHEQEFIRSVSAWIVWSEPTERQGKWLRSLFLRLGGRL